MESPDNILAFPNRKAEIVAEHIGGEPIGYPPATTLEEFKKRADEQLPTLSEAERDSIAEEEFRLHERRIRKLATVASGRNVTNLFDRK